MKLFMIFCLSLVSMYACEESFNTKKRKHAEVDSQITLHKKVDQSVESPYELLPAELKDLIAYWAVVKTDACALDRLSCLNKHFQTFYSDEEYKTIKVMFRNQVYDYNETWFNQLNKKSAEELINNRYFILNYTCKDGYSQLDHVSGVYNDPKIPGAQGCNLKAIRCLLQKKLSPNQVNSGLKTFFWPIKRGFLQGIKEFVEYGADLDMLVDIPNQYTPLHVAVNNVFPYIVQFLCHEGVKVNCYDYEGLTPLLKAVWLYSCCVAIDHKSRRRQDRLALIIEFLIEAGANPYLKERHKYSNAFDLAGKSQWILSILKKHKKYIL